MNALPTSHEKYMRLALAEAEVALAKGEVPIGAVVVCHDRVVARAHNLTETLCDPTAHAEVSAIRAACKKLGTFNLSEYEIFTSCEPCPMCLGAIYWAHLSKIYYGNNRTDAAKIGFDDDFIYKEIPLPLSQRSIPMENLLHGDASRCFEQWREKSDKTEY